MKPLSMLKKNAAGPVVLAAALLAGCTTSAPPERFYSLSSGLQPAAAVNAANAAAATATATVTAQKSAPLYVEVQTVTVPQQVNRNQLVMLRGEGRVELLEQDRWVAPLAAEVSQALSLGVTGELGAIDVFRTAAPEQAAVYRISTSVQRFESAPGRYALVDAVWSVRRIGQTKVLACRSVAEEPVSMDYGSVVAGHRRAMARLSADIAKGVRTVMAGGSSCP